MDRPNLKFKEDKYSVSDNVYFSDFIAYYVLDTKPKAELENDNQPEGDIDILCSYTHMSLKERMRCKRVKLVVRYHTPNPATNDEPYAHHILTCFIHSEKN